MAQNHNPPRSAADPPPVYVVSGGVGTSGEQLARTVLARHVWRSFQRPTSR